MANQVWSGHLTFGLISIPVKLIPAARSEGISFNMLHRTDLSRVGQQHTCKQENKVIERSEIVKGFEFRKDEYIVVEPEEIRNIEPQSSKEMEILEFVEAAEVDPVYFDSSYYIVPEQAGTKAFALLTKAMEFGKYYGIAKLFMHNREYTVIVRHSGDTLMLHTMFYRSEIRDDARHSVGTDPDAKEVEQALKLIVAMSNPWVPEQYFDGFMEQLKAMIQAKMEGTSVKKKEPVKKAPVPDMMDAIKKSLADIEAKKKTKK